MTFLVGQSGTTAMARPRTYLNLVLDESSSMGSVRAATIEAVNAYLNTQRGQRVDELFVTLTKFSDPHRVRVAYTAVPIERVQDLRSGDYIPDGETALYDGVATTLAEMERKVPAGGRVLTVVITDGGENASREVRSLEDFRRMIQEYEQLGNYTFVFLAANQNAFRSAVNLGFKVGNTASYSASAGGVSAALQTLGDATVAYRSGDSEATDRFYGGGGPKKYERPSWNTSDVE